MKRIIQDIVAQLYHKIVWKKSRLKPSRLEIGSTYNYNSNNRKQNNNKNVEDCQLQSCLVILKKII